MVGDVIQHHDRSVHFYRIYTVKHRSIFIYQGPSSSDRQGKRWPWSYLFWNFEGGERIGKSNKDQGSEYQIASLILQAARLLVELLR